MNRQQKSNRRKQEVQDVLSASRIWHFKVIRLKVIDIINLASPGCRTSCRIFFSKHFKTATFYPPCFFCFAVHYLKHGTTIFSAPQELHEVVINNTFFYRIHVYFIH